MKTTFFTLLFAIAISFASSAQTQKGTLMIGGTGSADFNDGFSVTLNPNLGYFITDDVAVGSGLSLYYAKSGSFRTVGAGLQPFARYYFGQQAPTRFFAVANASFYSTKNKIDSGVENYENTYTSNSFGGGLGVVHFLTEQVGLEAQLLYSNNQIKTSYEGYNNSSRDGGFGLSFGVQIHLPRSTKE